MDRAKELDAVRRVLAGDTEAFAGLVRAHQGRVLRLAASLLGDRAAAEDAAQEAFVKAFASLSRFRGESSFSTWLYRIAANHCMDIMRGSARRRDRSLEALLEAEGPAVGRLISGDPDPGRRAEDADLAARLLAALSPEHRTVLVLREAGGLTYDELSAELDISLDAVKSRLRRARRTLEDAARHFAAPENVQPERPS